ncbi:MAG: fimbria major subunit [Muribaculaceae bacterium]|nr:fimbria major subunit [Muribaculaceae bacterium]
MNLITNIKSILTSGLRARHLALGTLTALLLASCSDDTLSQDPSIDPGISGSPSSGYSMILNVVMPSDAVTRGETENDGSSSDGELAGTDIENSMVSATVYFCIDNKVVYSVNADYVSGTDSQGNAQLRVEFGETLPLEMEALVGNTVQIYVVGNVKTGASATLFQPSGTDIDDDLSEAKFSIDDIDGDPIGDFGTNGHLMPLMNAKPFEVEIDDAATGQAPMDVIKALFDRPTATINWWDVEDNVNDSKILYLERGVARIEFKDIDGRPEKHTPEAYGDLPFNKYGYYIPGIGDHEHSFNIKIVLTSMQVFNINDESYLFRHASKGNNAGVFADSEAEILGVENSGNGYSWVATPDWTATDGKWGKNITNFLNPLEETKTSYKLTGTKGILDLSTTAKIDAFEARTNGSDDGFHPWCYVSENTLPTAAMMQDYLETEVDGELTTEALVTKYATGVLFKFLIYDYKEQEPLSWIKNSELSFDYPEQNKEVWFDDLDISDLLPGGGDDWDWDDEDGWSLGNGEEVATRDDVVELPGYKHYPKGITNSDEHYTEHAIIITDNNDKWVEVFPDEEDGKYYLYYIACITHNVPKDGSFNPFAENAVFPPMYYGVVRNNTYQMRVAGVNGLPLPQDPRTFFLRVDVNVLPWTVRKNSFEF